MRMNLEDYKDISFPNILVHVLIASCRELDRAVKARSNWMQFFAARRFRKELAARELELSKLLYEPDREDQQVRTTEGRDHSGGVEVSSKAIKASLSGKRGVEREVARTIPVDKLGRLQIDIPRFKHLFCDASRLSRKAPLFLVLDDFYFVPKAVQPEFIDFFHRLTKDTPLP